MPNENNDKKKKAAKSRKGAAMKKPARKPAASAAKSAQKLEMTKGKLVVRFDKPDEIVPLLLQLTRKKSKPLSAIEIVLDAQEVLGVARASAIVSACAKSTSWLSPLGDLGLNPAIFRSCVRNGIQAVGFQPVSFQSTPSTRLIDVINAIQGATK